MAARDLSSALDLCREHDLLPKGGHVLCAVSGGADSVCLLHWLNRLRTQYGFSLSAAHFNHRLRGEESRRDEEFVRSFLCKCCPGVPLIVGSGDVSAQAQQDKAGIEETARNMRYAFLQETARSVGAQVIATAHNAEDNAETLLLHLIRGSGLRGLTGIPPRRDNIVRPLLTTRRSAIEEYLHIYGLPHVEDSSNADVRFTRNRVRHQLLPLLQDMQPQFISHMTRTAALLARDEAFLSQQARQLLPDPQPIPGGLSAHAPSIADQPDALSVRMIRLLLDALTGDAGSCTAEHLHCVLSLCRGSSPSAQICLPGGIVARRYYDRLELLSQEAAPELPCLPLPLPGRLSLPWGTITAEKTRCDTLLQSPYSFYLSCSGAASGLIVRSRCIGDTLALPGRPSRTLKKIFIDEKIPRHQRALIPVLDCGGLVAAVAGLGPDSNFLPAPGEDCWHIVCTPTQ